MSAPHHETPDPSEALHADDERELAAFVGLLRGATPDETALAPARAAVLAVTSTGAAAGAAGSLLTVITGGVAAFALVFGLGAALGAWTTPEPQVLASASVERAAPAWPDPPGLSEPVRRSERAAPTVSDPDSDSGSASGSVSDSVSDSDSDSDSASASASASVSASASASDSVSASDSDSVSVSASVAAADPASVSVSGADSVSAPASEPASAAASDSDNDSRSPRSRALRAANADYAFERYAEAATALLPLTTDGARPADPREAALAELTLAKALLHLDFPHAALATLRPILADPSHAAHSDALPWAARLAAALDDPDAVAAALGAVSPDALAPLDRAATRHLHSRLLYLVGRARYEAADLAAATDLLGRVPAHARWGAEAALVEAVAWARRGRTPRAEAAARRALRATRARGAAEDAVALRDLAHLTIARLRYARGVQARSPRDLAVARAAWGRFALSDANGPDAYLEEAWALRAEGRPDAALGRATALTHSARGRRQPEGLVLSATIQAEHCQWDAASRAIERFHRRTDAELAALRATERMARRDDDALRLLRALRAGTDRAPAAARPRARHAVSDRALTRSLAALRGAQSESARVAPSGLPEPLRVHLTASLTHERARLRRRLADQTRRRLASAAEDLEARMTEMDTVELDVVSGRREELTSGRARPMGRAEGEPVWAVQGAQRWPYRGELWPDEARDLVRAVRDRCVR